MKLIIFLIFVLLTSSQYSFAVIKRHDIPAKNYEVAKPPEYLVDMPHEGHGVLIAPRWIVTVAHTIFYDYTGKTIKVGNKDYEIAKVVIHSGYTKPDESLFKGDSKPLMDFFKKRDDIALIKLSSNVDDITPIKLYEDTNEQGKTITVYGRGATGNGLVGELAETKKLRSMNSFQNIIEESEGNWLSYKFDSPPNALDLEGMHGSGDSGGSSVIIKKNRIYLVGLSSWQSWDGELSLFKGGLYENNAYQVRISSYYKWIHSVIKSN
ncbi:trypsin-like serine protease [Kangiella koreensis]|uniref:Peptidase S1 and S6 chymotrypsin/Hap n=1 Tax=Kangiella koreensis (strain DSM 16069 / JCM 12317 / KCTC 12182 / SW-125) TaxID=523791 RepID=C7RB10_KANKD|nr:trypsin-like serine protease [Kangiella koreensis]ACV26452.1 peptidase S1 and S6 chymotrypsin/Hap [Kangiella koreensis DSM 16069]